jgi:hypothetical protein
MKCSTFFTTIPAVLLGIVISLCLVAMPVSAQTPVEDLFELDGNAIDETAIGDADDLTPPDDWGEADATDSWGYVAGPPPVNPIHPGGNAHISAFIDDPNGDTGLDNIFHAGDSKDDLPIEGWLWTIGTPPDKDDLLGVGAAAYLPTLGELLIYDFGSLYAANGSSSIGNWFFHKDIGPCAPNAQGVGNFGVVDGNDPNRPCLPDEEQPASLHTKGDVLIISENRDGGKTTNISVYTWVEGDASLCSGPGTSFVPPKDNLCLVGEFAAATCDGDSVTDPFACGVMNQVPTEAVDDYYFQSKSQPDSAAPNPTGTNGIEADDFPEFSFFESGINISELLGNTECFSSFMKNTRTSHKPRSRLKDFAGGAFELCGIEVDKACDATLNTAGDQVDVLFGGEVRNTGVVPLKVELFDDEPDSLITAVCYDINGTPGVCDGGDIVPGDLDINATTGIATFTLGPGETVLYEGYYVVTGPISSLDFSDTISAVAYLGTVEVDMVQDTAKCSETGTAGILVSKDCIPYFDSGTTFRAEITGGAENTGNVKLINVTLSDDVFLPAELTVVTDTDGDGIVDSGEPAFDGDLIPGEKLAYAATFTSTTATSHFNEMTVRGENVFDPGSGLNQFDDDSASTFAATCKIAPNPDLKITKDCDETINGTGVRLVQLGGVVSVEVGNIITVENTGEEVLDPVEVNDSETALSTLETGWDCTTTLGVCKGSLGLGESITFTQTYYPDGANIIGALMNPGSVFFKNTATAAGLGVLSKQPVGPKTDFAECKICPPCPTCN